MYENTKRFTGLAGAAVLAATLLAVAGCTGSTNTSSPAGATTATPGASAAARATATTTATAETTPVPTPAGPAASLTTAGDDARILWTFAATGSIYAGATVSGGAVYFGSDDGYLYSVDTTSHSLRWKFKTGGLVRSIPAVDGSLVYVASDDGYVYAVKTADGGLGWKVNIGNNATKRLLPDNGTQDWDFHQSSPVVSGGVVYVGSADKHVYALDAATGSTVWTFKTAGIVRAAPAVVDGVVYVGSWMDSLRWYSTLYALDAKTGTQKWSFMGAGDHPTPTVVNGMVYVGGRQAFLYAIDTKTGVDTWSADFQTSWVESTCAYVDGAVIVGSSALGLVQSFDAATGNVRWQFAPTGYPWSSPAVTGGVVYIGTAASDTGVNDKGLYAIDAKTGKGLWWVGASKTTLDSSPAKLTGIAAGPAVSGGVVYVGALDGKLYAIKAG